MESPFAVTAPNNAAFFYYTPDTNTSKPNHHGHFLPHPSTSANPRLAPVPMSPTPSYPSQLVYGGSENVQSVRSLAPALSITPVASPSLQKLNTTREASDMFYNPSTPPLSYSAVSTPALTSSMLTPMSNHGWSNEERVCGTMAPSDMQLAAPIEWHSQSPDMPTYIFPSQTAQTPSIVVNDSYCPALSPCSSQTASSPDPDFCDPRHLTFNAQGQPETEYTMEFPALSSFATDNSEDWQGSNDLVTIKTENKKFDNFWGGLFEFEENNTDLEWEDDMDTLSRSIESPVSPASGYQTTEDEEYAQPSLMQGDIKKIKAEACPAEAERLRNFKFGSREEHTHRVTKPSSSASGVIRRGRKQSLTEDPSKTFICHLCNRRFRRQEHLKRHFRSLHTEDKPFSCGECGKKFSRSDNLTQHARIHGSGAIVLGVLEENQIIDSRQRFSLSHDEPLGLSIVMDPLAVSDQENKSNEEKRNRRRKRKSDDQI